MRSVVDFTQQAFHFISFVQSDTDGYEVYVERRRRRCTYQHFVVVIIITREEEYELNAGEAFGYHDADDDRLAALTLAIKLNAGLTFSCCVRLS